MSVVSDASGSKRYLTARLGPAENGKSPQYLAANTLGSDFCIALKIACVFGCSEKAHSSLTEQPRKVLKRVCEDAWSS
jgi:hypothetical protein